MAWTASVTSKEMVNGVLAVTVVYTDGSQTITETYRSPNAPATWIPGIVRDRLGMLATLQDVPLGAVTPAAAPPTEDTALTLFSRRCELLSTVKVLIDLGAVQADNAKVVALVNWVKNNFAANIDKM